MNDKYINEEQDELDRINEQAYAEQDMLSMEVESIERQLQEGIYPITLSSNVVNMIKANAIREAADIDWVMVKNEPAVLRHDLIALALDYEAKILINT